LDVAIEAVIRDVELSVVEPLVERRTRFVERPREWLLPKDLVSCVLRPESGEILCGARVERGEIGLLDVGLGDKIAWRLEDAGFGRHRFDVGHALFSSGRRCQAAAARCPAVIQPTKSNQTRSRCAMRPFCPAAMP